MSGEGALIRGRPLSGKPNAVDVHVGERMRQRRIALSMTQTQVGGALGLTFQQIQKYEHGSNRVSASRLWELSVVLQCSVGFFFDKMDQPTASLSPRNLARAEADPYVAHPEKLPREAQELVKAYCRITTKHVRLRVYELTRSLARATRVKS